MPDPLQEPFVSDQASQRSRRPVGAAPVDPLPPALHPGRPLVEGAWARLEPIDPRQHAEALFAAGHADDAALALWAFLPYGPFDDAAAMRAWQRSCAASADPVFYAIRDRLSGTYGGMASYLEIRPLVGVIEIGHIWFAPPLQNTVQSTEALFLLMRRAFDDLQYRRLEWKCNALNEGSRRAALRLGFRFEGVFYNHMITKGRNRDTAYYSIIDSEWPGVRANFDKWLADDNFDNHGRQRTSLSALNRALW